MPDGQAWIELVKFHTPSDEKDIQQPFANTLGIRHICFAVEDFIHKIGVVFLKRIYVIRHCEAAGQPPEAQLTDRGLKQAIGLCEFFSNIKIDRIISSPYKRAIESIQPLAKRLNIEVEIESQLTERALSTNSFSDWFEKLRTTFDDIELKFEGGESSLEAMKRIVEVVDHVFNSNDENTIIVTHGNLMSLLLKHFNKDFGFDDWKNLSNPDVYLLENDNNKVTSKRLWK